MQLKENKKLEKKHNILVNRLRHINNSDLCFIPKSKAILFSPYRNDGESSIDNMAAERAIRLISVQRKNSLFFGSVKGIQNSAIYNTFIETCKQTGVSFRDYFCKLLRELKKGRTDYENLLPITICK